MTIINELVINYLHFLTVERGLSANTVTSYRNDLDQFVKYLKKQNFAKFSEVTRQDITAYLQEETAQKKGKFIDRSECNKFKTLFFILDT